MSGRGQEEHRGDERTDDGAGVIHGAMEAVDAPAVGRIGPVREQRVPWCAAHALADAVGKPDGEHLPPAGDERDERARRGREHVTRNHQPAPGAGAIGQATGDNAQQAVGALRHALDEAER